MEAGSSECRSLGSSQYPSGRFPKVSIGITVERCQKLGSGTTDEDGATVPTGKRMSSSQRKVLHESRSPEIVDASEGKQADKNPKASAWFSTRSVCHETLAIEAVQLFANRASLLQSEDGVHKKLDTVAFGKRREKDGDSERVEEVAFTTMEEVHVPDKGIGREHSELMNKNNNETLKMKLWKILGANSENKQNMNLLNLEDTTLHINHKREPQMDNVGKPKQNSDTIETDFESPYQTMRRPVTLSLAWKKVPSTIGHKLQHLVNTRKSPLSSSSSGSKLKLAGKNVFSFEEGEGKEGSLKQTVRFKGKRSEQKKARIEPQRIYFPRQLASDKSMQTDGKEQMLPSPGKASPQSEETAHCPSLPGQSWKDFLQPTTKVPDVSHHLQMAACKHLAGPSLTCDAEAHENDGSSFLKKKTHPWEHLNSSPVPNDAHLHQRVGHPSAARNNSPLDDFQCPTFAMNASTCAPSPRSELPNEVFWSPAPVKNRMLTRKLHSSKNLGNSRRKSWGLDAETETTNGAREIHENQLSPSPFDDQDTKGFEANNFFKEGCKKTDICFSDAGGPKISPLTLYQRKRVRSQKIQKLCKINLSSPSPNGTFKTEETTGSHEFLEQYPEDSLEGAVCQLALVLERFKSKIRLHIVKRSSEILSVAEEKMRLQLQDVESCIQADVRKFINTGNSKRKHLESKFHGKQGKLKFIHHKFNEEIGQHLLNCRRTLEEFGSQQTELKGYADRQRASHRKLLLQVEEAMEAQLNDAETSIAAIHKEAREKMNGLKHVLKELLAEGMICCSNSSYEG